MKLRVKFILVFIILIALLIGALDYYLNIYLENYLKTQAINNFKIIAEISEGTYFAFTENAKIRTIDWGSDGYIRNTVEKIINASLPESGRENSVKELNVYLKEKKIIYDSQVNIIDVLDKEGIVIASSREDRIGVNEKEEEEKFQAIRFKEALIGGFGEAFIKGVVSEEDEFDKPMIHVTTRIFSTKEINGQIIPLDAVLLLHFTNTEQLSDVLSGKWQRQQGAISGKSLFERYETAEIYLVNSDKLMISSSRFEENVVLRQQVDTKPIKVCFEEDEEINEEYLNYKGIRVFGASICLRRDNAVLVMEASVEEIFNSLKEVRNRLILIGFLIFTAGIIAIIVLSNWLLNNLLIVIAIVRKISENNFSTRINIKSKDEIGNLADTLNLMLDSIEKSQTELKTAESKLKEVNLILENKIKERTMELVELKNNLEKTVFERTKELQEKLAELEKFKELTVGRELKMIELKKKIKELEKYG